MKNNAFLTKGITYLKPKGEVSNYPAKYSPIVRLNTLYKIITACIAEKIYNHCEKHELLADEQKGSWRKIMGCKKQLIVDETITEQAYKKSHRLHMT